MGHLHFPSGTNHMLIRDGCGMVRSSAWVANRNLQERHVAMENLLHLGSSVLLSSTPRASQRHGENPIRSGRKMGVDPFNGEIIRAHIGG